MTADLCMLDYLVQPNVINQTTAAPPGSPSDGDTYIVAASPSGAWTGQAKSIAYYSTSGWIFSAPSAGWVVYDVAQATHFYYTGSAWATLGGDLIFSTLSVNGATASSTNRVAVASQAILFTHDSTGGNQVDCRININKAAAGNTASVLYQDAFSGRAEVGLCGDDNFHFKVSADGSAWFDAIQITDSTGAVNLSFDVTIAKNGGLKMGTQTSGAGSAAGTLTNAPKIGNPDNWIPVMVNGVQGWVPWWHA